MSRLRDAKDIFNKKDSSTLRKNLSGMLKGGCFNNKKTITGRCLDRIDIINAVLIRNGISTKNFEYILNSMDSGRYAHENSKCQERYKMTLDEITGAEEKCIFLASYYLARPYSVNNRNI